MTQTQPYSRKLVPPLSALAAFDVAARTGSFTLAASELSVTPGAISRQILLLENLLGVRLFERVRKRVVLTPAGAYYAERVREGLAGLATATAQTMASGGKGSILKLGILPSFGTRWLIPRMPEFFAQHRDVTVHFANHFPGPLDFARQNLDAAINFGDSAWPGAKFHKLMGEELIPVAAPILIEQLGIRTFEDVRSATLLVHVLQVNAWSEWFAAHGLKFDNTKPTLSFEQFMMVLPAAIAGLGIALVPAVLVESELSTGALIRLFPPSVLNRPGHYHYLVYPIEKQDYPPIVVFREWLLRQSSEWQIPSLESSTAAPASGG